MKKKLAILLGVLAISSMSFGATDKKVQVQLKTV